MSEADSEEIPSLESLRLIQAKRLETGDPEISLDEAGLEDPAGGWVVMGGSLEGETACS